MYHRIKSDQSPPKKHSETFEIRGKDGQMVSNVGKWVRASHDWFWFILVKWVKKVGKFFYQKEESNKAIVSYVGHSARMSDITPSVLSTVLRCQKLLPPLNGLIVGECDNSYGSTCRMSCDDGYNLLGAENITCEARAGQITGYWDNSFPVCKGKRSKT